jgi:hypothetical protein
MTWVLTLNDMRAAQVEMMTHVCRAESRAELVALIERERVVPYHDGQWLKVFRQGGPLEWFNPPWEEYRSFQNAGTEEEWANGARQQFRDAVLSLPVAPR